MALTPLFSVSGLNIHTTAPRATSLVSDLSFSLQPGECLGIVGESGSGKTLSTLVSSGLERPPGLCITGASHFGPAGKQNLLEASPATLRPLFHRHIGFVFQEPMSALNPFYTCGNQVLEACPDRRAKNSRERVMKSFRDCGLDDAERIYRSYPHQLSGGQLQRVVIAMAMAKAPMMIIADEPNTALDPETGKTICNLLRNLCRERKMALIFISHDLDTVADMADRTLVMQQGKKVESEQTTELFHRPQHPYTQALLHCHPAKNEKRHFLPVVSDFVEQRAPVPLPVIRVGDPLLEVNNLVYAYPGTNTPVVSSFDLTIREGESVGLVGPSGSGKSTIGKCIAGWLQVQQGSIMIDGYSISDRKSRSLWPRLVQYVFQDPYSSLNPQLTIARILREALRQNPAYHKQSREQLHGNMTQLMAQVDLPAANLDKYPHQLSGGQRQRIVIARALCMQPRLMVLDESVAALDLSVQAQVLNLLKKLQAGYHLSYLLISHDPDVVEWFCDRAIALTREPDTNTIKFC